MKYFIAFSCVIAYVAATAINLEVPKTDACACLTPLQDVLKQVSNQVQWFKDIQNGLTNVDVTVKSIDVTVNNQTESLTCVTETLTIIIKNENDTNVILNKQTVDLQEIFDELCEVCENTECIEEIAEQQTCILESLEKVATAALEDCNGLTCQAQIGALKA